MTALVPELVNMASDPGVSTADLLRRSLVVARRLDVPDFVNWINAELTGYRSADVPDYRRVRGQVVAEHPQHGYIPFIVPAEVANELGEYIVHQSVPELTQLMESTTGITSHFQAHVEQILLRMMREEYGVVLRPALKFSLSQVKGVIEAVRSRILNLALDLEGKAIIGTAVGFTQEEKQAVQHIHNYHFGNVETSQIQINSDGSTQSQTNRTAGVDMDALRGLIDALAEVLDHGQVPADETEELRAELATLRAQAASPRPKWEVIRATARSIKTVAEGAAGSLLAELAKPHVVTLLALAAARSAG